MNRRQLYNEAFNLFFESTAQLMEGNDELTQQVKEMIDSEECWEVNNYESFLASLAKGTKFKAFLTPHTIEEFKEHNVQTYLLKGFSIGYALYPCEDGNVDIISVHNNEPEIHGVVDNLIQSAIRNGGTQLDHFEGVLSDFYSRNGLEEYDRWQWDDQYAPKDWDYEKYGRPDVVLRRIKKEGEQPLMEFFDMLRKMDNKSILK